MKLIVKDSTGKLIDGATVKLVSSDNVKEQMTNAAGEAAFKDLYAGSYTLRVLKFGYPEYTQSVNITRGENKTLCDTFLGR